MSSSIRIEGSLVPQRATALILIIGIHVGLVVAFASGLARNVVAFIPRAMELIPTQEQPRHTPQPPPMANKPILTIPRVTIPEPVDVKITQELVPVENVIDDPIPNIGLPLPPQTKPINRVVGGVGKAFPNTDDYYPPGSIRLGETGSTALQVCVDTAGRLTSAPTLAESSGSARLDEGALKLAKAGSGHYRPTTEDGRPVDSCYGLRITFKVRN